MKKEIGNGVAYLGDCLEVMEKLIEQGIKVDVIICDPPYNLTACAWDKLIPFDKMWEKLNKLIKPNGAIVLFGSEPFSSALRMSNIKNYKYDWIWEKSIPSGGISSKYQPMKKHEIVSIFATGKTIFNGIKEKRAENVHLFDKGEREYNLKTEHNGAKKVKLRNQDILRNPTTILKFNNVSRWDSFHPTQKPVALLEYLIKTYTNEGELVLDFTSGSGTTGVACQNLNRQFIMIEKDTEYFNIGTQRILNLIK